MKLLERLASPSVPPPMAYEKWEQQATEGLPDCEECNNEKTIECPDCCGTRDCQCGCPNCEGDCEECDGKGLVECECAIGYRYQDYVEAYARDISLLFDRASFVMPPCEIKTLAFMNASIVQYKT